MKTKRGKMVTHTGKGSKLELLPNRHALNKLSGGDPMRRTTGDYAKAGPDIVETGPSMVLDRDMDGK